MSTDTAPSEHQPDPGDVRAELDWPRVENAFLRTQRDVLLRLARGYAEDGRDPR